MTLGYNYDLEGDSCINETPPVITITTDGESTFEVDYIHIRAEDDSSSSDSSFDFRRRRREGGSSPGAKCDGQGRVRKYNW